MREATGPTGLGPACTLGPARFCHRKPTTALVHPTGYNASPPPLTREGTVRPLSNPPAAGPSQVRANGGLRPWRRSSGRRARRATRSPRREPAPDGRCPPCFAANGDRAMNLTYVPLLAEERALYDLPRDYKRFKAFLHLNFDA